MKYYISLLFIAISNSAIAKNMLVIKESYNDSWISLIIGGSGLLLIIAGIYYYMNGLFKGITFSDEGVLISYPNKTKTAGKLLSLIGISSIIIACVQ